MLLVFREHSTNNLELYIAPECPHEDFEYADVMLKHFSPYSIGITTKKELDRFKIFVKIHGHELFIIPKTGD